MLTLGAAAALLFLASPETAMSSRDLGLRLDAGIFAALPTVLGTGQLLGPAAGARFDYDDWSFGLRARLGFVEENDLVWQINHRELRLSLSAARVLHLGRGALFFGVSGGGLFIFESRLRHQADRLGSAGLVTQDSATAGGPFVGFDLGARVYFYEPLWMSVEGGPTVAFVPVDGALSARAGWVLGLSLGYAFGK